MQVRITLFFFSYFNITLIVHFFNSASLKWNYLSVGQFIRIDVCVVPLQSSFLFFLLKLQSLALSSPSLYDRSQILNSSTALVLCQSLEMQKLFSGQ